MSKKRKKKTKDFSRRDFIRVSAGAVVAAGIGCGTKDEPFPPGTGGQFPGQSGTPLAGGGVSGGMGGGDPIAGSTPMVTGGTPVAGQGGAPTGGTVTSSGGTPTTGGVGGPPTAGSGGVGGPPPAGSGGAVAGTGPAGTGGGEAGVGGGVAGSGGTGGGESPLVAVVRDVDWAKATQDAIEMAGGLPDLTGQTVLLKPNIITSNANPETTNIEVIRGAIQAVKAKNAARIIVGEDGFGAGGLAAMTALGVTTMCQSEDAEAMSLTGTETVNVSTPGATAWGGNIPMYKTVVDADYVINMPVCKTHASLANYSLALKNWYGVVSQKPHDSRLAPRLPELHLAKQEDFVVLDASKAIVSGGPQLGFMATPAEPRIVVASRDAIAADITGLCILKKFGSEAGGSGAVYTLGVWEQPQITRALELAFPGWISSPQAFSYDQIGVTEHAEIMAHRDV